MENYTVRDILKEIKAIFPRYKTRKRSYVDKRNYLICILYYKFNYSEEMIADIFSLSKFAIDRSTVNHAKRQPARLISIKDSQFIDNISILHDKFPFTIPETSDIRFVDKEVTITLSNKQMCQINNFAQDKGIRRDQAFKKLIGLALNISDTNLTEMLWEE